MTKLSATKQGFTVLGFSKSGFSCCSSWHICDYGKNGCVISDKDHEAHNYCHCYQRNKKQSTELDALFDSINDKELDGFFGKYEVSEKFPETVENKECIEQNKKDNPSKYGKIEQIKNEMLLELSTMSDLDILQRAVKSWVRMSASTNAIEGALKQGDKDAAFREFKRMINESGSSGGMISFFKLYKEIEIKTIDGRYYNPTEKELWNIYYSLWEGENTFNLFSFI